MSVIRQSSHCRYQLFDKSFHFQYTLCYVVYISLNRDNIKPKISRLVPYRFTLISLGPRSRFWTIAFHVWVSLAFVVGFYGALLLSQGHTNGGTPINTLRPRQNGRRFENTFSNVFSWMKKCIFFISLKFVHKGPLNNIPAFIQMMAWCLSGGKPLSEPMMVSLLTHVCVTFPLWVNRLHPELSSANVYHIQTLLGHWCQWSEHTKDKKATRY